MRRSLTNIAGIALSFAMLLTHRAAAAQTPPAHKHTASIRLTTLIAASPFYDALAQDDRDIATLESVRKPFLPSGAAVRSKEQQMHALDDSRSENLRKREEQTTRSLFRNAASFDKASLQVNVQREALEQAGAVRTAAKKDLLRYRDDLETQKTNTLHSYARLIAARIRQAYDTQARALRERESFLAFTTAQGEAGERSQARMRLDNLTLTPDERMRISSLLKNLDRRDASTINAQRKRDAPVLDRTRKRLRSDARSAYNLMREHLKKSENADLAERRRIAILQADDVDLPATSDDAKKSESLQEALQTFRRSDDERQDTPTMRKAFQRAGEDVTTQFATLRNVNASTQSATDEQIAELRRDRQFLREKITEQIMRVAQKTAEEQGLGAVYPSAKAPARSIDLTAAVKKNLQRLFP